jgi:MFS family permease
VSDGLKFGPIRLAPGISTGNMWTLIYACFFTIGLLAYVGVGTPYVLTGILNIPADDQGIVTGQLVLVSEITAILLFGPVGLMADRIGRKGLFAVGFVLMGLGYALYPLAGSLAELLVYRVIYAAGVATCTGVLAVVVTDYPSESTRGRLVAVTGFMNGLGVAILSISFGFAPRVFTGRGADVTTAGVYTHWLVAAFCVLSAIVVAWGLKGGTPARHAKHEPLGPMIRSALRHGSNPRIALSYAAAFIARGDLILVWTGVVVFVLDRFNRVTTLAWCMFLATLGYLSMGVLVDSPIDRSAIPFLALLGIGQISAFFGSQSLVGQEAPMAERGAVVGGFNTSGAIGILFCSAVGGWLFSEVSPHALFTMIGVMNGLVFLMAVAVRLTSPGRMPGEPAVYAANS